MCPLLGHWSQQFWAASQGSVHRTGGFPFTRARTHACREMSAAASPAGLLGAWLGNQCPVTGSSCPQQREFPPGEARGGRRVSALVWGHGNVQLCAVLALGLAVSCSCAGSRREKPRRPRPRPCVRSCCWAGWKLAAGNGISKGLVHVWLPKRPKRLSFFSRTTCEVNICFPLGNI